MPFILSSSEAVKSEKFKLCRLCVNIFLVIQDKTDAEKMYKFYIKVESSGYSHKTMMELFALSNNYTYCVITYTMKNQEKIL